ncbi:MAG: hypothetical protein JO232_09895 [Verrucomicrobia bacterium]|nr:hypothetical protein [Verrucomicrobiota bacterium]
MRVSSQVALFRILPRQVLAIQPGAGTASRLRTYEQNRIPHLLTLRRHSEAGVRNGSFIRLIYSPAALRGYSTFINGDYMGREHLSLAEGSYERKLSELTNDAELREFTLEQFKQLAPKCCR